MNFKVIESIFKKLLFQVKMRIKKDKRNKRRIKKAENDQIFLPHKDNYFCFGLFKIFQPYFTYISWNHVLYTIVYTANIHALNYDIFYAFTHFSRI